MKCRAEDCGKPSGSRVFCRECAKALQAGEFWMLRMTFDSPMHSDLRIEGTDENPICYGMAGWKWIDGSEELMIRWTEEDPLSGFSQPCFQRVGGISKIVPVLAWLEYELAVQATAEALTKRRRVKASRARLKELRRVTAPRRLRKV